MSKNTQDAPVDIVLANDAVKVTEYQINSAIKQLNSYIKYRGFEIDIFPIVKNNELRLEIR